MVDYQNLELFLLITTGTHYRPGWPRVMYWLNALNVPGMDKMNAHLSIVTRSVAGIEMDEHDDNVEIGHLTPLFDLLDEMKFPGRNLDVEGVTDSTNNWSKLTLQINRNDQLGNVALDVQSSGFRGDDAANLKAVMNVLFDIANLEKMYLLEFL